MTLDTFVLQRAVKREGVEPGFLDHDHRIGLTGSGTAFCLESLQPLEKRRHIAGRQLRPRHAFAPTRRQRCDDPTRQTEFERNEDSSQLGRLNGDLIERRCDWSEGLFRHFDNRRQLAAYAGLAPTPWQSGSLAREQGISKAGNARIRTTMVQLSWLWLRHQPKSALTLWFHERTRGAGGRNKRIVIIAVARKLLVSLWKFATTGLVPEGAVLHA